eukprot:scaffold751_cov395-Prasinococcus_capsulatus_cf.AAC.11
MILLANSALLSKQARGNPVATPCTRPIGRPRSQRLTGSRQCPTAAVAEEGGTEPVTLGPDGNATLVSRRGALRALAGTSLTSLLVQVPSPAGALGVSGFLPKQFEMPSTLPTNEKDLVDLVRRDIASRLQGGDKGKAPPVLRLVFHDAGTFDPATGTGGINGSILMEVNRPENRGLKIATNLLLKVQKDFDDAGVHISFADLVALGGTDPMLVLRQPL